jgi:hypothetical protein
VAEQRDVDMFYRLVNGIRVRQSDQVASSSEQSIASIMVTRYRTDLEREKDPMTSHVSPDNAPHNRLLPAPFTTFDHGAPYSVQEDAEEWSISGFEDHDLGAATTAARPPTSDDHETDEGEIFDFDM